MFDLKLTELMFKSLKQDPSLANAEDWEGAGDYAAALRFLPHAFNCYRNAMQLKKTEEPLIHKVDVTLEKLTNVLEYVPKASKALIDEIRLNNPLDPSAWLNIVNSLLKEGIQVENLEAIKFVFGMTIYCAVRSQLDVTSLNQNLLPFLEGREFDEADLKFNKVSLEGVKTIVALGDNVTLGLQNNWELKPEETFHYLWHQEFSNKDEVKLINSGISGAGILDAMLYLGRDVINHRPDMVLINYGMNDAWLGSQILLAYEALLEYLIKFLKLNSIKVILIGPVPHIPKACPLAQRPNPGLSLDEVKVDAFNKICKQIALRQKVPFVDLAARFPLIEEQRIKYFANGFNQPNLEGHTLIKNALEAVCSRSL